MHFYVNHWITIHVVSWYSTNQVYLLIFIALNSVITHIMKTWPTICHLNLHVLNTNPYQSHIYRKLRPTTCHLNPHVKYWTLVSLLYTLHIFLKIDVVSLIELWSYVLFDQRRASEISYVKVFFTSISYSPIVYLIHEVCKLLCTKWYRKSEIHVECHVPEHF